MRKPTVLHGSHNYFIAGGSDRYFLELGELLSLHGHKVIPFCAASDRNEETEYSQYFPSAVDPQNPKSTDIFRFLYSREARHHIQRAIAEQAPDIAHLHIYYGKLTASILGPLRDSGIPVVQTLHEYKLLCPVYTCVRDDVICEDCQGRHFWKAGLYRCNRGSVARSIASAAESYVSKWLGSLQNIDHFIGVSQFMTDKMRSIGVPADKISTVHNFVDTSAFRPADETGDYVLYFGRLEKTKGLFTLLEALRPNPGLRCVIAGTGPAELMLRSLAAEYKLNNVEFPGFVSGDALHDLIRGCACTVLPSEWFENCPMSVLESLALARPVIGSRIGGIPELIEHERDGLLVEPGDVDGLANALRTLSIDSPKAMEMGRAGRSKMERQFSPEIHYAQIKQIYDKVLA